MGYETEEKLKMASARKTPSRPKTPPEEPAVMTQDEAASEVKPPMSAASQNVTTTHCRQSEARPKGVIPPMYFLCNTHTVCSRLLL